MESLIHITKTPNGEQAVSARELYQFLEIQTEFAKWTVRMFEYGFSDNLDYTKVIVKNDDNSKGGKSTLIDYALTLDTAKEIAMLQRSEKGKQARQYFIDCEKQLKNASANLSPFDVMQNMLNQLKEQERLQLEQSKQLQKIEKEVNVLVAQSITHQTDYFTVSGYYRFAGLKYDLTPAEAQKMGKALTSLSGILNYSVQKVSDVKFGCVGAYHKDLFKTYFEKKQVA